MTIESSIGTPLKCQEKNLYFLPKYESLSEVYKNKISVKPGESFEAKTYKLVDNVDKSVYNYFLP